MEIENRIPKWKKVVIDGIFSYLSHMLRFSSTNPVLVTQAKDRCQPFRAFHSVTEAEELSLQKNFESNKGACIG